MIKKIIKQIKKVEKINKNTLKTISESCNYKEGDGQFYNGVYINKDIILVCMTYWDSMTTLTEYFHYSIFEDRLELLSGDLDDYYREMFEDCNILDYKDCFFIFGIEPTKNNKAKFIYGDKIINKVA